MLINDVKKGMRVQMANGWFGTMYDNRKGTIRQVDVEGDFRETGSVYAHDIKKVKVNGVWEDVELSPAQLKASKEIQALGF